MTRLEELTLKLLDQTISEIELAELESLTELAEEKDSFLQLFELESHLQSSGRSSTADRVFAQIQQERCDRVEEGVMDAVSESAPSHRKFSSQAGRESSSRLTLLSSAIAILAACLLFVFFTTDQQEPDDAIARLNPNGCLVKLIDSDGKVRVSKPTEKLLSLTPNQVVETTQAIDVAEIVYTDGTKIELLGETRIRVMGTPNGGKEVHVLAGLIQADVGPKPNGGPLKIITQAATFEVVETILGVEVREDSTQLGVATGRVPITRVADGQRVEVEAGRYATVTGSSNQPLRSHPFPDLTTEWSEDFAEGLPSGWRSGALVHLQDTTAVRSVRSRRTNEKRFVITSQNAWQEGNHALCRIDRNSTLHLRIRQSRFARITIMIGTRSYPPFNLPSNDRIGGNLFYTLKSWNEDLPADTWRTISVPLNEVDWQVKQREHNPGRTELESLAAYLIHVSTMTEDIELTIDRMWITNEGEGF